MIAARGNINLPGNVTDEGTSEMAQLAIGLYPKSEYTVLVAVKVANRYEKEFAFRSNHKIGGVQVALALFEGRASRHGGGVLDVGQLTVIPDVVHADAELLLVAEVGDRQSGVVGNVTGAEHGRRFGVERIQWG